MDLIARIQRKTHAGSLPGRLDRPALPELFDEPPQTPGIEATAGQRGSNFQASAYPAAVAPRAFLAPNALAADSATVGTHVPTHETMAYEKASGPALRALHRRQITAHQFDVFPIPEEKTHLRSICITPAGLNYT